MDLNRMVELSVLAKTDPGMKDLLDRAEEYYILKQPADPNSDLDPVLVRFDELKRAWGKQK